MVRVRRGCLTARFYQGRTQAGGREFSKGISSVARGIAHGVARHREGRGGENGGGRSKVIAAIYNK